MSATGAWVVSVTGAASTGNVYQLYPSTCTPGVAKAGSTNGQLIRRPLQGAVHSIQVETNGVDGGTIELYDIDGGDAGADVSSGTTITNAQLTAAIAAGLARLIFQQNFVGTPGSGTVNAPGIYRSFAKGLAARYISDNITPTSSACTLNLVVSGGFWKVESRGGY